MRGRPDYYRDTEVVENYHLRYTVGLDRWKHARKSRVLDRWIEPHARVLEVACGPGRYYDVLGRRDLIELDRSPEMLRELLRHHPRARAVRADASALPFADASFDTVVALRIVSHLRGSFRAQVLSELARVARRRVIIDGRHLYNLRTLSRWIRKRLGLAHAYKLRHTYGEYREELGRAGLELVAIRSIFWGLSARVLLLSEKRA